MRRQSSKDLVKENGPLLASGLIGAIVILLFPSGARGLAGVVQLALPIVVMVVFGLLEWRKNSPPEAVGDRFYYLGFVFTLLALTRAMAPSLFGYAEPELMSIVRAFGVALSTTVVGLLGKVALLSAGDSYFADAGDLEDAASREAAEALRELRSQIRNTIESVETFGRDAREHWSSVREAELRGIETLLAAHKKALSDQSEGIRAQAQEALGNILVRHERSLADLETATQDAARRIAEAGGRSVDAVGEVAQSARRAIEADFRTSAEELSETVGTAKRVIDDAAASFEAAGRRLANSAKVASSSLELASSGLKERMATAEEELGDALTALVAKVSCFADRLAAAFPSPGEYEEAVHGFRSSIERATAGNRSAMQEVRSSVEETGNALAAIRQEIEQSWPADRLAEVAVSAEKIAASWKASRSALESCEAALARVTTDLERAVQGAATLGGALEKMGVTQGEEVEELSRAREELAAARRSMIKDVEASQEALVIVMEALSGSLKDLRSEIRPEARH